ncbi:hypothetical protein G6O69_00745 [Pseudenhygromyxa sp. WMMC2535]|uniref:gp53-like domain-containing protein n=1 Tax=Pseudenhygromyxa sp. WMMC2535 TaxID=2712867 RepID=UPI001551D86C|nr:hypothetical protein [Pseudenhygromyxa sp. WMMC2535]NVB36337.1 hypothetical protein [Pseudenhygromyxa sp. WMMC2535]
MLVSHLCPTNSLLAPRQQPAVRRLGPFKSSAAHTSAGSFTVDRDAVINGSLPFTYLAIGPAEGETLSQGILRERGVTIQWGRSNSSSDDEQLYSLPTSFGSMNFSVVTSIMSPNIQAGLSVSRPINEASFIVNRDAAINGTIPFNWIAVGW